jgi:FecR protein
MKRSIFVVLLAIPALSAAALSFPNIGSIDYIEGGVSIGRSGKVISAPNIGDPVVSGDLIKTQNDGLVVIAMGKNTGMGGKLTVKSRSSLYINVDIVKGEPRTQIQMLTGAIGSKVNKLSGSPTMTVTTSSAVMAVRGTEYEVVTSINASDAGGDSQQATLVTCTESKVAVNDGQGEVEVPAGKVLEKRPGARPIFLPVALSSVKGYSQRWIAEEITAFKADAPKALGAYAKRYNELSTKFAAAFEPFQASPTPKKWAEEDRSGAKINPLDPAVLREKKEIAGYLLNLRKVLFIFERVYYRVDGLSDAIAGTDLEKREIRPGQTAADFIKSVYMDRDKLEAQVARYHYIEALFRQRSPDGDAFSDDDDFFASSDGF